MINQFLTVLVLFAAFFFLQTRADNLFCEAGIDYGESGCQMSSSFSSSSSSKILIKGGIVVNAHHQEVADVYVEDGLIVAVQPNIKEALIHTLT
ncbi:Dihydropyrimidinase [Bienertia sinuspersici]